MGYIEPMKAQQDGAFLSSPDYISERKFDGTRVLAELTGNKVILWGRSGHRYTQNFPLIVKELSFFRRMYGKDVVLDGELVYLDKAGNDQFDQLSKLVRIKDRKKWEEYVKKYPTIYYVFDIIKSNGRWLGDNTYANRRTLLEASLGRYKEDLRFVRLTDVARSNEAKKRLLANQKRLNREGVMYKKLDSTYIPGYRSPFWRKHKFFKEDSAIIIGYELGKGNRKGLIGALYTAQWRQGKLWFTGKVGSGFVTKKQESGKMTNKEIKKLLDKNKIGGDKRIFSPSNYVIKAVNNITKLSGPEIKKAVWLYPKVICDVKYMEVSSGGRFRHGVFLRLRFDVKQGDVTFKGR